MLDTLIITCATFQLLSIENGLHFVTASLSALSLKEDADGERLSVATSYKDFMSFVRHSDVFIDRTMFIKYMLYSYKRTTSLIVCPRSMGKSLNLDTIAAFLSTEVDENGDVIPVEKASNYRLFVNGEVVSEDGKMVKKLKQPLLIAKERNLIVKLLGKHPVLKIDLSTLRGVTYDEMLYNFKIILSDVFAQHKYMMNVFEMKLAKLNRNLTEKSKLFFKRMLMRQETNESVLIHSIRYLCDFLHSHFRQRPYIFIDEYDTGFNEILLNLTTSQNDRKKFTNFFRKFMFHTSKANPDANCVIATAVLNTATTLPLSQTHDCKAHGFFQYYGISENELDQMFEAANIPSDDRKEVERWYNGYRFGRNKHVKVFNPLSIAHFINSRKFQCYWVERPIIDNFLHISLAHPYFRDKFSDLAYNRTIPLMLTSNDFLFGERTYERYYVELMQLKIGTFIPCVATRVLHHLYYTGYLEVSPCGNDSQLNYQYIASVTNLEALTAITQKLNSFYEKAFQPDFDSPVYLAMQNEFYSFLFDQRVNCPKLAEGLERYLKQMPEFVSNITKAQIIHHTETQNEAALRIILGFLTFKAKYKEPSEEMIVQRTEKSNVIFFHNGNAAVVELHFNRTDINQALEKSKENFHSIDKIPKTIKYIAITTCCNKTVNVDAVIKQI